MLLLVSLEISVSCCSCDLYKWPKCRESQTERGDSRSAPVTLSVRNSRSRLLLFVSVADCRNLKLCNILQERRR